MLIHVNRYYETWGPADVEAGDTDRRGADCSDAYSFRELVDLLRDHPVPSASPLPVHCDGRYRVWFSSYDEEDYRTGDRTTYSVHLADTGPRAYRYWLKAARIAHSR